MDPFANLEMHKSEFTKNDMLIYAAVMENPERVTYISTSKLAEICGVSQSAISRFVRTLGYDRYQDFRSDITAWVAQQHVSEDPNRLFYFERLEQLMTAAEQVLTDEYLRELTDYLLSFDTIYATGIGKSLEPAKLLYHLLRKTDRYVRVIPLDSLIETADHMFENELIIVFSVSGQAQIMERIDKTRGKILLVTTNVAHAYQDKVDRTVVLPFIPPDPELCSVSPVLFDVFVELLVNYASKALAQ